MLTQSIPIKWNKQVKKYYETKSYTFTEYGNMFEVRVTDLFESSKEEVSVQCDICGKKAIIRYKAYVENIKKNSDYLCISCGKVTRTKYIIEDFKKICDEKDYILVSDVFHPKDKIKYICNKHHDEGIKEIAYNNLLLGQGCSTCASEYTGSRNRTPFVNKKLRFKDRHLNLLTKSTEYKNSDTPLSFICKIHNSEIQETTWANFLATKRTVCRYCNGEHISRVKRMDFSIIQKEFVDRGCILLTQKDEFINAYTKLRYNCVNHPETISETTWSNFRKGQGCHLCKSDKLKERVGENNPSWKGGISSLAEYLRCHLKQWKQDSMRACNYKCVVSGNSFDEIHHMYPFTLIFEETLMETGIQLKTMVADYSLEELMALTDKCLEIHYRYPLGACMSQYYHDLFHSEYKYRYCIDDVRSFIYMHKRTE